MAAGEGQPLGQALAAQEADRLVHRGQRPRGVPALCPGGDPRVEQGVREDRLQGRHRRPLAERTRRLRAGGYQLLHPALDHHRPDLRDVGAPQQPADRRDDRRRRDLRRELDQDAGRKSTRSWSGCRSRPAQGQAADQPTDAVPLAVGEIISPIMAAKQGYGQLLPPPGSRRAAALDRGPAGRQRPDGRRRPRRGERPAGPRRRPGRLGPDPGPAPAAARPGPDGRPATTPPPSPTRCASPRWPWRWPPTPIRPTKDDPQKSRTRRRARSGERQGRRRRRSRSSSCPRSSWARRSRKW